MDESNPNSPFSVLLKRAVIVIVSSGILINAALVFGQSYYQGYVQSLGFDPILFPVSNSGYYLWAYWASISGGLNLLGYWREFFLPLFVFVGVVVYLASLAWNAVVSLDEKDIPWLRKKILGFADWLRVKSPRLHRAIGWIFMSDASIKAGRHSYISMHIFGSAALLVLTWILFPLWGYVFGMTIAGDIVEFYEADLCLNKNNSWDWCIEVDLEQDVLRGRIILANDMLLGIYTEEGAVTITRPEDYYNLRTSLGGPEN